jgi:hypothetical protein
LPARLVLNSEASFPRLPHLILISLGPQASEASAKRCASPGRDWDGERPARLSGIRFGAVAMGIGIRMRTPKWLRHPLGVRSFGSLSIGNAS